MTFEEEFPSLKGKGLLDYPDMDDTLEEWQKRYPSFGKTEKDVKAYDKQYVKNFCLDKERVKALLLRKSNYICSSDDQMSISYNEGFIDLAQELIKELGL